LVIGDLEKAIKEIQEVREALEEKGNLEREERKAKFLRKEAEYSREMTKGGDEKYKRVEEIKKQRRGHYYDEDEVEDNYEHRGDR